MIRPRLVEFTAQMLGPLGGYHQPAKGELCVRGLLTNGQRKSMQPMAERLGVDHQRLQQFITSSSWDYPQVRANVARWAADAIDPQAYVVDDCGFPKDGTASPYMARQYSGTLGKTANCQIGVSIQMVTDHASLGRTGGCFAPRRRGTTPRSTTRSRRRGYARRTWAGILTTVRHRQK
jgi:SRSO17 transposase